MRYQGKIANWNDDRGFGFIIPYGGGDRVFVHVKAFSNRRRRPVRNEIVSYDIAYDNRGRAQARNVAYVRDRVSVATLSGPGSASLILVPVFLSFVAVSALAGKVPFSVVGLYFGSSAIAYVAYALDKSAAENNAWRIRESTLHILSLIGGWPGALLAQKLLRHKSKKHSFRVVFWATVAANFATFVWFHTHHGSIVLRSFLGTMA